MVTRTAAVQLLFRYFDTPQEFADAVRAPVELAAENGAQVILLPHRTAFMLFGMFDFRAAPQDSLDALAMRQNNAAREWLRERAPYVYEFYLHLFQSLAAHTETWLVPGTVLEPDDTGFFMTACVFNPAGEIVGRQRQLHCTPAETAWGVKQGDALRVHETAVGDFGMLLGEDARYPESARALRVQGANVLLYPAAYEVETFGEKMPEQISQEPRRDAQANQTFAVQANLVGEKYRGRSAIYAPAELTDDQRGVLAQTADETPQIVLAELDLEKLETTRRAHPISDL